MGYVTNSLHSQRLRQVSQDLQEDLSYQDKSPDDSSERSLGSLCDRTMLQGEL